MTEVVDQSETVDSAAPGYQIEPLSSSCSGPLVTGGAQTAPRLLHLAILE